MDKIKKNNSVESRIKKLRKSNLITYLLMIMGVIFGDLICASAIVYMFPIVNFIMLMLDIDYVWRYMINNLMYLFFTSIPLAFLFVGNAKIFVNDRKIKEYNKFGINDLKDKTIKISKKEDERQKKIIDEIMMKIERLPRSKQMEILNYIKDKELMSDINLCNEIDKLNDENLNSLQDKCEDVLFSDYGEEDDAYDYTRKRKKII